MYKGDKNYIKGVAANIDTIYEFTKDGWDGTFTAFNNSPLNKVVTELVKRGVLVRTYPGKGRRNTHYEWAAPSAPTKTFYKSVADALRKETRARDDRYLAKKAAKKAQEAEKPSNPIPLVVSHEEPTPPILKVEIASNGLKEATIEELWAELKSRGVMIENNQLVVIEKRVIA